LRIPQGPFLSLPEVNIPSIYTMAIHGVQKGLDKQLTGQLYHLQS
jgi:hypothetical protein